MVAKSTICLRLNEVAAEDKLYQLKRTLGSIGAAIPASSWTTSMTKVAWAVKWVRKGLMPIPPKLNFSNAVSFEPGMAFVFSD